MVKSYVWAIGYNAFNIAGMKKEIYVVQIMVWWGVILVLPPIGHTIDIILGICISLMGLRSGILLIFKP